MQARIQRKSSDKSRMVPTGYEVLHQRDGKQRKHHQGLRRQDIIGQSERQARVLHHQRVIDRGDDWRRAVGCLADEPRSQEPRQACRQCCPNNDGKIDHSQLALHPWKRNRGIDIVE